MTNLADELERLNKLYCQALGAGDPVAMDDLWGDLHRTLDDNLPDILSALRGEADLKESVVAFAAPHAARYASEHGMAPGYLHPTHYDLLKRCGARMDDFTRAALPPPPTKGTSHE